MMLGKCAIACLVLSMPIAEASSPSGTAATIDHVLTESSMVIPRVLAGHRFWVDIGARTDFGLSRMGYQLAVGYRLRHFGFDARLGRGSIQYNQFSVRPGESQLFGSTPSAEDPASEINRPRSEVDPWSFQVVEPGLSVASRLFVREWPWLTERARFGFAYGTFNDDAHAMSFAAYLFTFEAMLVGQLGEQSPWSITAALTFNTGVLISKEPANQSQSYRRLPANWLGTAIGIQYSF